MNNQIELKKGETIEGAEISYTKVPVDNKCNKSTYQQVFMRAAKHMMDQFEKAYDKTEPKYRCVTPDGRILRDPVGLFIADKTYFNTKDIENKQVLDLFTEGLLPFRFNSKLWRILVDLQQIHDRYPPVLWQQRLKSVATNWKLNWSD